MTKTAFVFPGQGSQSVGMLSELVESSEIVRDTFSEASDALEFDLWQLISSGPKDQLDQTDNTQPALLASSVAIWRHYLEIGGTAPIVLAGHSLGEYSALTCAGVIELTDAIKLVRARGQYMQEAVPAGTGAMAAVLGLEQNDIIEICSAEAQDEVVSAVNFNSPGQVVIAGHKAAVERAGAACKNAGAKKVMPIPVSVPSHCELMKPAAEKLAQVMEDMTFKSPQIPVINNVDVAIETESENIRGALVRQLYCPVRWTETVMAISGKGAESLIECGPGKVLTGLAKRIDKSLKGVAINNPESISALVNQT